MSTVLPCLTRCVCTCAHAQSLRAAKIHKSSSDAGVQVQFVQQAPERSYYGTYGDVDLGGLDVRGTAPPLLLFPSVEVAVEWSVQFAKASASMCWSVRMCGSMCVVGSVRTCVCVLDVCLLEVFWCDHCPVLGCV